MRKTERNKYLITLLSSVAVLSTSCMSWSAGNVPEKEASLTSGENEIQIHVSYMSDEWLRIGYEKNKVQSENLARLSSAVLSESFDMIKFSPMLNSQAAGKLYIKSEMDVANSKIAALAYPTLFLGIFSLGGLPMLGARDFIHVRNEVYRDGEKIAVYNYDDMSRHTITWLLLLPVYWLSSRRDVELHILNATLVDTVNQLAQKKVI